MSESAVYRWVALSSCLLAVIFWSTAVWVGYALAVRHVPFSAIAVWGVAIGTIVVGMWLLLSEHRAAPAPFFGRLSWRDYLLALFSAACLAAYQFFFWYALIQGPRLPVNSVNYLWPIFQIVLSVFLFRDTGSRISPAGWLWIVLCFLGAQLAIGLDLLFSPGQWGRPHVAALAGALFVGLHFASMRHASRTRGFIGLRDSAKWNVLVWSICIVLEVAVAWALDFPINPPLDLEVIAIVAYEGIIVFGIGYLAYNFSIQQYPSIALSGLVYLTPVLGAIWLQMFGGERLTTAITLGLAFIVVGNVFLHSRFTHLSATVVAAAAFAIAMLFCLVTTGVGKQPLLEAATSIAALLGILFGFNLSRLTAVAREQSSSYLELRAAADTFEDMLESTRPTAGDLAATASKAVEHFKMDIADFFFARTREERQTSGYRVERAFRDLVDRYKATHKSRAGEKDTLQEAFEHLAESYREWMILKTERISVSEWITLSTLSLLFVAVFAYYREASFGGDVAAVAIATGFAYLLATLRNLEVSHAHIGGARMALTLGLGASERPYVPKTLVESGALGFWLVRETKPIRTRDGSGAVVDLALAPVTGFERGLFIFVCAAFALVGLGILSVKH